MRPDKAPAVEALVRGVALLQAQVIGESSYVLVFCQWLLLD